MTLSERYPDVELVSVDSMQVYRGMDIGTAKPTADERLRVRHHLIDLFEPDHEVTVVEFAAAYDDALAEIAARGHRAVLVGGTALGISPGLFLARMQETAEISYLFVGLSKAPLFAIIISLVGCLEGLKVQGSAESVGRHTTSSVVQSIFLVILIDAIAAIFFMELDI